MIDITVEIESIGYLAMTEVNYKFHLQSLKKIMSGIFTQGLLILVMMGKELLFTVLNIKMKISIETQFLEEFLL